MKDSKRIWVWVGVAVVVVAAVIVVVWRPSQKPPAVAPGPVPVFAPKGQLVPQFPKELILDSSASVAGSYSIAYSSSTNQYTAQYDSSSTVTALFNQYKTYFAGNGWTVTGTLTTHPTFDVIAATKDSGHLQVVINKNGTGSQTTITYVAE